MTLRQFYTPHNLAQALVAGVPLQLHESLAHRLHRVLRLPAGATLALIDNQTGRYQAVLEDPRLGTVRLQARLAAFSGSIKPKQLALCLPKKEAWETVLRQATELGITQIQPLLSQHAVPDRLNFEKARQRLIEAAEQAERLSLPVLLPLQPLATWLAAQTQPFYWAYERLTGTVSAAIPAAKILPATVLVGPEGGFAAAEVVLLQAHFSAVPLSLGATILRVDTAVIVALAKLEAS